MDTSRPRPRRHSASRPRPSAGLAATLPALLLVALASTSGGGTTSASSDGPPPTMDMVVTGAGR